MKINQITPPLSTCSPNPLNTALVTFLLHTEVTSVEEEEATKRRNTSANLANDRRNKHEDSGGGRGG